MNVKMALKVESLSVSDVIIVLENSDMKEFIDFVKEKEINGEKLLVSKERILVALKIKNFFYILNNT